MNTLLLGDSMKVLATLEADSIDACVTDPPYDLTSAKRSVPAPTNDSPRSRHRMGVNGDTKPVGGFMGKEWDGTGIAFDPAFWREVFRVMKPGAHLLAFGGTRTYHRMTCAIEDAGFEIRDCLQWLYSTGFPKSLNISKQIDKEAGVERTEGKRIWRGGRRSNNKFGGGSGQENGTTDLLKYDAPATDAAKTWDGWGTALKPACEPIVLARKPLQEKTVAKNVLRWGTGGLNIDESRIGEVGYPKSEHFKNPSVTAYGDGLNGGAGVATPGGRWPANVLLSHSEECVPRGTTTVKGSKGAPSRSASRSSEYGMGSESPRMEIPDTERTLYDCAEDCPVRMLDEQTGVRKSGAAVTGKEPSMTGESGIYGPFERVPYVPFVDSGGASRFFYVAKSSRSERNEGLAGVALRQRDTSREQGKPGGENPRNRGAKEVQNHHPTVKPVELMRYLVRLITPPGTSDRPGLVLDPFMGSGTTGIACEMEHFNFTGIEREEEYMEIARRRIGATPPSLFGGNDA